MKHGLMTVRDEQPPEMAGHEMGGKRAKRPRKDTHQHKIQHRMESDATFPQVAALSAVAALALIVGLVAPANWINMTLSARDVSDLIMPHGMIMDRDTTAETMRDMAAVDPRLVMARYGLDVSGGRPLEPRVEKGVKVFDLNASVIEWTILPGVKVDAYAYNGQVPGPQIRVRQGDQVRINVTNHLPDTTTVHWLFHGHDVTRRSRPTRETPSCARATSRKPLNQLMCTV